MSGGDSPLGEDWQAWKARLEEVDFHPSKRLGQNFLLDPNLLNAIARDAEVGPGDKVIEVGTGLGFLTRALLATGASVSSIEVDRRLHELLKEQLGEVEGLELIRADACAPITQKQTLATIKFAMKQVSQSMKQTNHLVRWHFQDQVIGLI